MTGMFAKSRAGHDKDKLYIIWKEDKEYYYLVDGASRTADRPKKKKKKHVQIVKSGVDMQLAERIRNAQAVKNEEIKLAIRQRIKMEVSDV